MLKTSKFFLAARRTPTTYTRVTWQRRLTLNESTLQKAHYRRAPVVYIRPLDPEISQLQDKIIYSDYIERQKFHRGSNEIKKILRARDKRASDINFEEMMNTPSISLALKYLGLVEPVQDVPEDTPTKVQSKPIYMPYAAEDKFKVVPEQAKESQESEHCRK